MLLHLRLERVKPDAGPELADNPEMRIACELHLEGQFLLDNNCL